MVGISGFSLLVGESARSGGSVVVVLDVDEAVVCALLGLGCLGGNGGKRGPEEGGSGLRPLVDRLRSPVNDQHRIIESHAAAGAVSLGGQGKARQESRLGAGRSSLASLVAVAIMAIRGTQDRPELTGGRMALW